jgi:hypothetical protein
MAVNEDLNTMIERNCYVRHDGKYKLPIFVRSLALISFKNTIFKSLLIKLFV